MIVPVLVEAWQQQCCGEPFAVGDRVSWTLRFLPGVGAEAETVDVRVVPGEGVVRLGGAHLAVRDDGTSGVARGDVLLHHADLLVDLQVAD